MKELLGAFMPGIAAMTNLHPLVVHFPIALLNAFLLMEILGVLLKKDSMRHAASWMLYLGTLGAITTVIAGFVAAGTVGHNDAVHLIMKRHEHFGITVLVLAVILSLWRLVRGARFSGKAQLLHIVVAIVTVAVMAFGADLGGLMVFKHGVAVAAVKMEEGEGEHLHDGGGHGGHHDEAPKTLTPAVKETKTPAKEEGHHHSDDGAAPHDH